MSHNIGKTYFINLNKRVDRREHIENQLNSFGLPYERYEAVETNGFGIYGCGLSHLNVLKMARENKYPNVLILEDDFIFEVSKDEFETKLTNLFNLDLDFDVCMLSYLLIRKEKTEFNFLTRVTEAQTASGYIVNQKYYDTLIDLYEWAMPLLNETKEHWIYCNDQIWKRLQAKDNWFCFTDRIGKQMPSFSDNSQIFYNNDF